jgi:hypothetical protein
MRLPESAPTATARPWALPILVGIAIVWAGCVEESMDRGDPSRGSTGPEPYQIRVSGCTVFAHTVTIPASVFSPPYPAGTRPGVEGLTTYYVDTFMCEQATDSNSTVAPFHAALIGAGIDPPGPSAEDASQSLAGFDVVTNHPEFANAFAAAGWRALAGGYFALSVTPADTASVPYELKVADESPAFAFTGVYSPDGSGNTYNDVMHFYTQAPAGGAYVRAAIDSTQIGNSQPAKADFSGETSWAKQGAPASWESINFVRVQASGTISIRPLATE